MKALFHLEDRRLFISMIVLALIVVSIVVGVMFANSVRMPTYGWKLGLILSTILVSTFVVAFVVSAIISPRTSHPRIVFHGRLRNISVRFTLT